PGRLTPLHARTGGARLGEDLVAQPVREQRAVGAVERLAVRPGVAVARPGVALARRAAAGAVGVELAGLVAEGEGRGRVGGLEAVGRPGAVLPLAAPPRGADGARRVLAHHLMHAVEAVRPPVGDEAAGVVPEPAERAEEPAAAERHRRRRAEVEVPVEAGGRLGAARPAEAAGEEVGGGPDADGADLAPPAALDAPPHPA